MSEWQELGPMDEHNRTLLANTHPADWTNPTPAESYNLVVVGAGTAGLVVASGAAQVGARVALVERYLLGGDCLNVGCVPSKTLIASSRLAAEMRRADRYGIEPAPGEADFPAVMERVRRVRGQISHHDAAERLRNMGVDVFLGQARFTGPDALEVAGQTLRFARACIATGARAVKPPIEGLVEAGFLTNETVFGLTGRPSRLAVLGGGPLGCELAQAFARLGSHVTIIERNEHILKKEDADAAEILARVFHNEGLEVLTQAQAKRVERTEAGKRIVLEIGGEARTIEVDEILVGAGRAPNVQDLGLEAAGVAYDEKKGVQVDDRLRTSNPRVYAAGDVCLKYKFTHMADATARLVVRNALFWGRSKHTALTVPWCTYTDPEIAHVGLYAHQARERGLAVDTYTVRLADNDRAMTEGDPAGFVKVHVKQGTDRILGATIVGPHASELINEVAVAMKGGVGLGTLGSVIHPYPTLAEAIKSAGDQYSRTRLTPRVKHIMGRLMAWRR